MRSFDEWAGKLAESIAAKQPLKQAPQVSEEKIKSIEEVVDWIRSQKPEQFVHIMSYINVATHDWSSLPGGYNFWSNLDDSLFKLKNSQK